MGDNENMNDTTDKDRALIQGGWFLNLIYWLIGIGWLGALTPMSPLSFWANVIGLW